MPWRKPMRWWRHAITDQADAKGAFPSATLDRIEHELLRRSLGRERTESVATSGRFRHLVCGRWTARSVVSGSREIVPRRRRPTRATHRFGIAGVRSADLRDEWCGSYTMFSEEP
jgi:hypothetical protein